MQHGKNTEEYQAIKNSLPYLSDAIAGIIDSSSMCEKLFASGLITSGQKADASIGMVGAKKRASDITTILLNKVDQDAKNFQMLVGVLQQYHDTFGTVLKHMSVTDGE